MSSYILIKRNNETTRKEPPNFGEFDYQSLYGDVEQFGSRKTSTCGETLDKWFKKIIKKNPNLFNEISNLAFKNYDAIGPTEIEDLFQRTYELLKQSNSKIDGLIKEYEFLIELFTQNRMSFFNILQRRIFRKNLMEKIKDLDYYQLLDLNELIVQNDTDQNIELLNQMGMFLPDDLSEELKKDILTILRAMIWKFANNTNSHLCVDCANAFAHRCRKVSTKKTIDKYDFIESGIQKIIDDGLTEKPRLEKFIVTKCLNFKKEK